MTTGLSFLIITVKYTRDALLGHPFQLFGAQRLQFIQWNWLATNQLEHIGSLTAGYEISRQLTLYECTEQPASCVLIITLNIITKIKLTQHNKNVHNVYIVLHVLKLLQSINIH